MKIIILKSYELFPSPYPLRLLQAQLQRLLAYQQAIDAELAQRNLQDLPLEKLFRLSDLISRQLQRLLKAAASSDVEVAILAAGDGGFQPPVPAQPASNQIKADQASGEITASEAPHSEFKVQSSTFEVQGSPVHPRPATSESHPEPASNQIEAIQACGGLTTANAPSSEFKVQGSELSALNSPPSTPQEHCLVCGTPLPPPLSNGQRPHYYCQCGQPLRCPPGTSLLEHCPKCGELQPHHGYNAFRHDNRCHKCWANLPPLDPKSRTPWLPPARPAISK